MNFVEIAKLESEIRYHNRKYYDEDSPVISDVEYDKLVKRLREACSDSPVLNEIGNTTFGRKVKHSSTVGSIAKCHTAQEVYDKFYHSYLIGMPKIDGCSLTIRYRHHRLVLAITRGDGVIGEDVTANVQFVEGVPATIKWDGLVEIRGEAYVAKKDFYGVMDVPGFDGFPDGLANPRNAASGALRQKDPQKTAIRKLRFIAYRCFINEAPAFDTLSEVLDELNKEGFEVPSYVTFSVDVDCTPEIEERIDLFSHRNKGLAYETDGVVFRIDDEKEFEKAGYSSKCPKMALAYKFETEKARSTIQDIEWTMTRMGRAAPVAIITPTKISGSVVGRITLNNLDWIKEMDVAIGDTILFSKANEIIPKVEEVISRVKSRNINRPKNCPSCGHAMHEDENGVHLVCDNPVCPAQYKEMLLNMLTKLGILGVAAATIDKIVDAGEAKKPWHIFDLTEKDLVKLGFGKRQAEIIVQSLHSITPSPYEVLAAIGIPMWGRRMFEILSKNNPKIGKEVLSGKFDEAELAGTNMVGPQKAKVLAEAFKNEKTFASQCLNELLQRFPTEVKAPSAKGGKLSGKSFLITGTLSKERSLVEKDIEAAGGEIKSGVSAKLDYLVVGESAGSKLAKAQKLGVKTLDEAALYKMIQG